MNSLFGTIGYSLTSIGAFFLLLLLLTTGRSNQFRLILLFSSLLVTIWAISSVVQIRLAFPLNYHLALESIRNLGWFVLLASALSEHHSFKAILKSSTLSVVGSVFFISCVLELINSMTLLFSPLSLFMLHLAQSVLGMWMLEQLYRRTERSAKWTIKPMCLGLGLAFTYDFFLYADAVLTQSLSTSFWYARGWVTVVSIPLILLTIRRVKHWSTRIYVSRDVVYHSTLLTVAGGYLLIMSLAGYYIKYAGGSWGTVAQNIFLALSGLVLASLFLSEPLRRKLKVFITKHFYANKYEYREEWMRFASILEEDVDSPFQVAITSMVRPFDCENGILYTLEGNKLLKQSSYSSIDPIIDSPILIELSKKAIEQKWIIDIEETKNEESSVGIDIDNHQLEGLKPYRFIVPISGDTGTQAVCLLSKPHSTHKLNWEDRDLMWAISKQLSVYLNLYSSNLTIAENQQFDTYNRMSAFLAHDLKNVLSQLQLLSKNAKKHRDNPEFIEDAFETIDSASRRLDKVVTHLKNKSTTQSQVEQFELNTTLRQACLERAVSTPVPKFKSGAKEVLISIDKERFKNILLHLIQNAQDATDSNGEVSLSIYDHETFHVIDVKDNGSGMTDDFVQNRLFKPFDTTKGNSGMGTGAYDAKKFVEKLGGYIEVESYPKVGTSIKLFIPQASH